MKKQATILLSTLAMLGMNVTNRAVAGQQPPNCESSLIAIDLIQSPLNFGSLTPCLTQDGTLQIRRTGELRVRGCIDGTAGIVSLATVRVRANQDRNNERVTVNLAGTSITVSNGTQTMVVTGLQMRPGNNVVRGLRTKTFNIEGTLNVTANQPRGTYTGNFVVDALCEQ